MDKNKLIQSKKFFKTFQIKDILENSNNLLNNVELIPKIRLIENYFQEHNLAFTNVKNKPLINSFKN